MPGTYAVAKLRWKKQVAWFEVGRRSAGDNDQWQLMIFFGVCSAALLTQRVARGFCAAARGRTYPACACASALQ